MPPAASRFSGDPPLRLLRVGDAPHQPALFLLPGLTGLALGLRFVAAHLDPSTTTIAGEAPGLRPGERPVSVLEHHARFLRLALPPDPGPLVVAGFSYGGLVAYELAVQLAKAGHPPAAVILFDIANPASFPPAGSPYLHRIKRFARNRGGRNVVAALRAEGQDTSGLDTSLAGMLRRWRVEGAAVRAGRRYRPPPPLVPVRLVATEHTQRALRDESLGWAEVAGDLLRVQTVSGPRHGSLRTAHARLAAAICNEAIRAAAH